MDRYRTCAARQALRPHRIATFIRPTLSGSVGLVHRPVPFRRMLSGGSVGQSASSEQFTAVPAPVAASVSRPSPASLQSLLLVCANGLCSRRLHWDELVLLVGEGRLEAMGRLDWQLAYYAESKADMLREYHTVTDRLRDQRLAAPCRLEDGRRRCDWTQQPPQSTHAVEPAPAGHPMRVMEDDDGLPLRVCWWQNEYGYAIDEGIEHHLVWSDRYLDPTSRLFQRILSEQRPASEFEVLTFINPPHLRSVPDLHHIHVFSRSYGQSQHEAKQHDARATDVPANDSGANSDKQ